MANQGVIYILTNPSFPQYVKIGYADNVESRLKQLNNSECIPFAFRIYATYEVEERLTDLKLHALIDQLNPNLRSIDEVDGKKRVREFYAMPKEQAYSILETIAVLGGRKDRLHLYEPSAEGKRVRIWRRRLRKNILSAFLRLLSPNVKFPWAQRLRSFIKATPIPAHNAPWWTIKRLNIKDADYPSPPLRPSLQEVSGALPGRAISNTTAYG